MAISEIFNSLVQAVASFTLSFIFVVKVLS